MKIYHYQFKGKKYYGILKEENLYPIEGSIFRSFKIRNDYIPISEVKLLPPVKPSKIICVGLNYRTHTLESKKRVPEEPLLFLKPPTSIIGPNEIIVYPKMSKRIDYEGEVAVVIKKKAYQIKDEKEAFSYILGYTCFNDVTARDIQQREGHNTRAKSFDTFAPIGPCIATDLDPLNLKIKTFLNGKLRQSGNTKNLVFSIPYLVKFISHIMTLLPGDIISTGTPSGVGPMSPGDRIDIQIEGIGTLSNTVMKIH
ncbi:fumarylacetoacetate hydrolase family protein [Candidatus Aminicenantes bacterium AC-708-M15]|jgi:2-keto-4-pentenoate hydratase/2-oxohepta-3-ene-1,7-dioic acid hydratase in catechol pathway|nr:fumarylacetoacetate hydrolase family protein [SCandidatus Aminicenantes bacterium Aminicenantia_JdfR_composite]MCP2597162.1 fumarylacetoacetate hydrolase family protein [Candidatus Aminicenantes bacterium AC-335-G13]MCP2598706.1 fumarylacetoacetate hydrolase family protein [Candidatus Aminicenantes bacterium AC-335-L06]MCP2604437.1 fumarylacetoacetate hydrolase family protein [Candidatus Aminicenantes bacterium AC-708-M15]MCP2618934.1 fumarylacetoacetate hydrolase family protein [Candidatus 